MRCALSFLLLVLLALGPHLSSRAVAEDTEADLGRKFSLIAQSQLPLVQDYTVRRYVERLGQRIVSHLDRPEFPYSFAIVREPNLNAFSVPGGYIYLHSGLILRVDSEDELAGVLGHEIAHVQGHHMIRQQEDTKLLSYAGLAAMALALINPTLAIGASSVSMASQLKYQRQLEEEADYRGLEYLRRAGFDPNGMPRFFKKMWNAERLRAADVPSYFRSHPLSEERLSNIERILGTFQWNDTPLSDSFELKQVQAILRALHDSRTHVIAAYQQHVTADPNDARALALLGTVLLHYRDWEQAQRVLEQAKTKGLELGRELGLAYLRSGQLGRARQTLARQSEIMPEDADTHNLLCTLFLQEGDTARAEEECRTAVKLDPRLDEAYLTLARFAQQRGQSTEAGLLIGQAMEIQGRLEAALGQYKRAAQALAPEHPETASTEKKVEELEELVKQLHIQGALQRRR
jgi:beta-barrel assembly-enhancing protease